MTEAQKQAANPKHSVWVNASAGTGKTKVLTDRILRLLLAGVAPGQLLCITFTKAAAAEMKNRLNSILAEWAVLPEAELAEKLAALLDGAPSPEQLTRAPNMLAEMLDAPDGVRIQTIHALCQSLLQRFPLEAGIAPHLAVLDDTTAGELRAEARLKLLSGATLESQPQLAGVITFLAAELGDSGFDSLIKDVLGHYRDFQHTLHAHGGTQGAVNRIHHLLELPYDTDDAALLAQHFNYPPEEIAALRQLCAAMLESDKTTDNDKGDKLSEWLVNPVRNENTLSEYCRAFLTKDGDPLAKPATKDILANPVFESLILRERERVVAALELLARWRTTRMSAYVMRFAGALLEEYEAMKARRGALDYDDLIERADRLLAQPGISPWILYKLDGGISHLLVDEAQDTSPAQWRIAQALSEEFFAGKGQRGIHRTLFVVGDEKQSIYRFQGADITEFQRMRAFFASRAEEGGYAFRQIGLDLSFRSTPAVLALVNQAFLPDIAPRGVVADGTTFPPHSSWEALQALHGRVELWPLEAKEKSPPLPPWPLPQAAGEESGKPVPRLARRIAETIAGWLDSSTILPAKGRPIRAGDVLILIRKRDPLQAELTRALKRLNVAVAGADRLQLTEELAVRDLLALASALLLPEDDLTLAAVLKSPLFGLSEEALFTLAWNRGEASLFSRLCMPTPDPAMTAARDLFLTLLNRIDYTPPFEFFAEVLEAHEGRKKAAARLGEQVHEPLDALLEQALAYEAQDAPSMQGFLHWLENAAPTLKRDTEQASDAVRIMTVHGAKGLQAPIVILADTTSPANGQSRDKLLKVEDCLLWQGAKKQYANRITEAVREHDSQLEVEEHQRLLYVAMTRAESRLIVCGYEQAKEVNPTSWYAQVQRALEAHPDTRRISETTPGDESELLVLESGAAKAAEAAQPQASTPPPLTLNALPEDVTADRTTEMEPAETAPDGGTAAERITQGILLHALLQWLPDLPPEQRQDAALAYLRRELDEPSTESLAQQALAVLELPELAPLFGPGSLAEAPVCGRIDGAWHYRRIDRLAITEDEILILDYKTHRQPPANEQKISSAIRQQMEEYRQLLALLYPERRVRCLILWTQTLHLMELPESALENPRAIPA